MVDDLIAAAKCGTDSIKTNAIITTFVESKKLSFGALKFTFQDPIGSIIPRDRYHTYTVCNNE